jgi:hypothetical protein
MGSSTAGPMVSATRASKLREVGNFASGELAYKVAVT